MPKRTPAQRESDRQTTTQKRRARRSRRFNWERRGWAIQRQVERFSDGVYGLLTETGVRCAATCADGTPCQSAAMQGGSFCRSHSR